MTVDFTTSVLTFDLKTVLCWHSGDTQNRVLQSQKVVNLFYKLAKKVYLLCICVLYTDINVATAN